MNSTICARIVKVIDSIDVALLSGENTLNHCRLSSIFSPSKPDPTNETKCMGGNRVLTPLPNCSLSYLLLIRLLQQATRCWGLGVF